MESSAESNIFLKKSKVGKNEECTVTVKTAHANANMALERSNFIQVNVEAVAKGYHKCPFVVQDNELFRLEAKIGERGPAFRICSSRGQLGHLQKELVQFCGHLKVQRWFGNSNIRPIMLYRSKLTM